MSARDVIARALLDSMALAHRTTENGWGNAEVILSALSAAGYAVVPKEPTWEMLEAAESAYFSGYTGTPTAMPEDVWRAMLAASEPTR